MYKIKGKLWKYNTAKGAWYFVTLDKKTSEKIKKAQVRRVPGWGQVKVEVQIGKTVWQTSIFPDKKLGSYVLPVKAVVRKKEGLKEGGVVVVQLRFPS